LFRDEGGLSVSNSPVRRGHAPPGFGRRG
jgi:hypothetical protein